MLGTEHSRTRDCRGEPWDSTAKVRDTRDIAFGLGLEHGFKFVLAVLSLPEVISLDFRTLSRVPLRLRQLLLVGGLLRVHS